MTMLTNSRRSGVGLGLTKQNNDTQRSKKLEGCSQINLPTLTDKQRNKLMGQSMIEFGKNLASNRKLQNQTQALHISQRYSSMDVTNSPKIGARNLNELSKADMSDFLENYKLTNHVLVKGTACPNQRYSSKTKVAAKIR